MTKEETKRFVLKLLKDLDWPKEQLAVELGVSWHTVDKWCNGTNALKGGNLLCLQMLRRNLDEHGVKSIYLEATAQEQVT